MKFLFLESVFLLFLCSRLIAQTEVIVLPNLSHDDIKIYKDIVYSIVNGQKLKLDIAVPKYLKSNSPAIVDFPGGAWRICKKSVDDALFYAEYGYIGVSAEYRTSDVALFPAAVQDCKAAIRWLRAHAQEYMINPDKIGVTGISAGAHLATILGTSGGDNYLEGDGDYLEYSSSVQAVVDHFGPIDFLAKNDTTGLGLKDFNNLPDAETPGALFLGGPVKEREDLARLANPITYIDSNDPPILIGHGEKDGMVIIRQSEMLFNALKKAEIPTEFVRVKNAGHQYRPYLWNVTISPTSAELQEITIRWFQKWLGTPDIDNILVQKLNKERERIYTLKEYNLYYKLIIDLPGMTRESYCKGRFTVRCESKVLAEGDIFMVDFSVAEKRIFQKEIQISGADLQNKEVMWNFRGEIFDSKLSEKYEPMYMQGEKFDDSIIGIGFTISIKEDRSFKIEKVVYKKCENRSN